MECLTRSGILFDAEAVGKVLRREKARDFLLVEKLLKDMEINLFQKNVKTWTILYSLKFEIAKEFYKEMTEKGFEMEMSSCRLLMNGLAESHVLHLLAILLPLYLSLSGIVPAFQQLLVIYEFSHASPIHLFDDALEIVDILKKKNRVDDKVYEIIIDGMSKKNDLPKALELFQSLRDRGRVPMTSTWTELMQHLFRSNDYDKGCELFDKMVYLGVDLDCLAITAMARFSEAWNVFKSMEAKGIKASPKSYFMFIKELCKGSRTSDVLLLLDVMRASNVIIGDGMFRYIAAYLKECGEIDMIEKVSQMKRMCLGPQGTEVSRIEESKGIVNEAVTVTLQEIKMAKGTELMEPKGEASHLVNPVLNVCNEQDLQEVCRILKLSDEWYLVQEALEKCNIQFTPELVKEVFHASARFGNITLSFFTLVAKQAGYSHTTDTCNMAIKIAGDMKDSGCRPTNSTYKYIITLLCRKKGRKLSEAIATFQEMLQEGHDLDKDVVETYRMLKDEAKTDNSNLAQYTYGSIVHGLLQQGRLDDALVKVDSMRKAAQDEVVSSSRRRRLSFVNLASAVSAFAAARIVVNFRIRCPRVNSSGHAVSFTSFKQTRRQDIGNPASGVECMSINSAFHMFDKLRHSGQACHISEFNQLLSGIVRAKQYRDAIAIYRRFRDVVVPDYSTLNILMNCYCSVGCTGYGFGILAMVMKRGYLPNVVTYSALIHWLCRFAEWEKAVFVFAQMKREGVVPNVVTYSALIRGLCQAGKLEEAKEMLVEMKRNGISPNVVTYTSLIHGLCQAGESEDAKRIFSEMKKSGISPDLVTYNSIIDGLCKSGNLKEAKGIFCKLIINRFIPDVFTYTSFIHGLSVGGKWEEAEAMLEEMIRNGISPNVVTYSSLIHGLCETGKLGKAKGVFCEMASRGVIPDTISYSSIIDGLCNDYFKEAKGMFCKMIVGGVTPDLVTYSSIIHGFLNAGKWEEAKTILREMRNNGISPDVITFNSIIFGLSKAGKQEVAKRILWEMKREGIHSTVFTYRSMPECSYLQHNDSSLFVIGNWEDAVKIYHEMNNNGIFPDVVTYNSMIHGMFLVGKIKEAKSIVSEMKSKGIALDVITLNTLIHGFCNIGYWEEAECIFCDMMEKGVPPDAITYNALISALIKDGKRADAYRLLEFMIERGERPDTISYDTLSHGFRMADKSALAAHLEVG
ncbi:unnamed protein product [Rhodiola kirilowii]